MSVAAEVKGNAASILMLDLAVRIADRAVRSDIELYATGEDINGKPHYDITEPDTGGDDAGRAGYQAIVDDALAWIQLRGDALPWRLVHHPSVEGVVFFQDKEAMR